MFVESWGMAMLAFKALWIATPDVFFDTTGGAFSYFVARILVGIPVGVYVHYPTISTDMLALVWQRRPTYNNDESISENRVVTGLKILYYLLFAIVYGLMGSLTRIVMVNSTWTYDHLSKLWWGARLKIVYPPCHVQTQNSSSGPAKEEKTILSIGQFRPEKDHILQIRSFALLRDLYKPKWKDMKFIMVGSCRGDEDEARVQDLRRLVYKLGLDDCVEFILNEPYETVQSWLQKGSIGIHTMWNEHFGIGIVEMMAAGLIVVAHDSGGPKSDIVVTSPSTKQTGFLAANAKEYAHALNDALSMPPDESRSMRQRARERAQLFSDDVFAKSFRTTLLESKLLQPTNP